MRRAWFTTKKYGYGATPSSWQGWSLIIIYVVLMTYFSLTLIYDIIKYFFVTTLLTMLLIIIVIKTTNKPWSWRLGR